MCILQINHDSIVHSMAWSPSTKLSVAPRFYKLATSGSDHNLRLFSSDLSGQNDTLRVLRGHRDYVNSMAFHPLEEGGQLVSGSDDHTMALWDSETGQRLQVVNFDHPIMSIIWHPEEVSKVMVNHTNNLATTGGPLLTLFFKTLEKQPCKQRSDLVNTKWKNESTKLNCVI